MGRLVASSDSIDPPHHKLEINLNIHPIKAPTPNVVNLTLLLWANVSGFSILKE
jgi:hypothetical protein